LPVDREIQASSGADLSGERHLVPLGHRDAGRRDEPAGENVDQVDAEVLIERAADSAAPASP
jgi:hypothetical protein